MNDRLVQDPAIDRKIQAAIQARVDEFRERLTRNVKKLTCDVERDDEKFNSYIEKLSAEHLETLAQVLRKELLMVIQAVEEAK